MDFKRVRSIVDMLADTAAAELRYKTADFEVHIRMHPEGGCIPAEVPPEVQAALQAGLVEIVAPMPGTVYLAPSPGADPYVTEGVAVAVGDPVALIVAMKTMMPVCASAGGVVVQVFVADGQSVAAGEVMISMRPVAS
jgi:acetyl-CoA carboxylase biotin carboxyl carrier protein